MEYRGGVEIGQLIFHCWTEWPIFNPLISNGSILILLIFRRRGIFRFVRDVWLIIRSFETGSRIPVEEKFICIFVLFIYIYMCVCVNRARENENFCVPLYDNSICIREFI